VLAIVAHDRDNLVASCQTGIAVRDNDTVTATDGRHKALGGKAELLE
jgi:hypothetical protein